MKSLPLVALALALSTPAFACEQNEAQIIGRVVSAQPVEKSCRLTVRLDFVAEHMFCPLSLSVGQVATIEASQRAGACPQNGAEVSGVLQATERGLALED